MIDKFVCQSTGKNSVLRTSLAFSLLLASSFIGSPVQAAPRIFNVKNYGAQGDGTADDSGPVATAIERANAIPGSVVLFPAGIYVIGAEHPVLSPDSISLEGTFNSTLEMESSAHIELKGTSPAIRKLKIERDGSSSSFAVQIKNANNYEITNDSFTGSWFEDVRVDGPGDGLFRSNRFDTDKIGVTRTNQTGGQFQNQTTFDANLFIGSARLATFINDTNEGAGILTVRGNTFTNGLAAVTSNGDSRGDADLRNNTFTNVEFASQINAFIHYTFINNTLTNIAHGSECSQAQFVIVSGNTIKSCSAIGVRVSVAAIEATIKDNLIEMTTPTVSNSSGIRTNQGVKVIIKGNSVTASSQSPAAYLIYGNNNDSLTITDNTISSGKMGIFTPNTGFLTISKNSIRQIEGPGIAESFTQADETISNNDLRNCMTKPSTEYDAMIWVDATKGHLQGSFKITDNVYTGKPGFATYFIHVLVGDKTPPILAGNKTTTMLPNKPPQ